MKKLKIADDTDLERILGVSIFAQSRRVSGSSKLLQLALREAEFLVELSHPNIVSLKGFVEDVPADIIWLVFSWEDNGNLREFIASRVWEVPERIWLVRSRYSSLIPHLISLTLDRRRDQGGGIPP